MKGKVHLEMLTWGAMELERIQLLNIMIQPNNNLVGKRSIVNLLPNYCQFTAFLKNYNDFLKTFNDKFLKNFLNTMNRISRDSMWQIENVCRVVVEPKNFLRNFEFNRENSYWDSKLYQKYSLHL